MAKKKKSRKELIKSPDEFLTFSEKALEFYHVHQRRFQYAGMAIVAVVLVYIALNTYMRYLNSKGQEAYNAAYYALMLNLKGKPGLESLQESGALFAKVMDEHGFSKAARLALPQVAFGKFIEKEYDEAIALYEEFLESVSDDVQYGSLARLALAACYEAKGDVKTAIKTLEPVFEGQDDPFKETALLSQARLYRLDHKPEKEKEVLRRFIEEHQTSPFLPFAKARL
ncbi:MAG: tetratricopeptide repeat protein [Deltaproteobacteria bacterium]|nr:tetratricopeptide repeat protein [Deltaproteobacteria bacterium]